MSADAVKDALTELDTILSAVTISGGAIASSYIHPFDYATYTDFTEATPLAPILVVEQRTFADAQWLRIAQGRGVNSWQAIISLYLAREPKTSVQEEAVYAVQNIWVKAIVDALFADQTLNGSASIVGARSIPGPFLEAIRIGPMSHPKIEIDRKTFKLIFFGVVHAQESMLVYNL